MKNTKEFMRLIARYADKRLIVHNIEEHGDPDSVGYDLALVALNRAWQEIENNYNNLYQYWSTNKDCE